MRLRLREFLDTRRLTVPQLVQMDGRFSASTLYRLLSRDGRVRWIDGDLLDSLCAVFGVRVDELLEAEPRAPSVKLRAHAPASKAKAGSTAGKRKTGAKMAGP